MLLYQDPERHYFSLHLFAPICVLFTLDNMTRGHNFKVMDKCPHQCTFCKVIVIFIRSYAYPNYLFKAFILCKIKYYYEY